MKNRAGGAAVDRRQAKAGIERARAGDITNPATGQVTAPRAVLQRSRHRRGGAGGKPRISRLARHAAAAPRAHSDEISRAARREQGRTRAIDHGGARQDARRCRRLGAARHRSRRVRDGHSASRQGRIQRGSRHRRRLPFGAPAARRVRGHHAVQFSGDGAAVDVPGGARVRQYVRVEAVRKSAVGVDADGGIVEASGAARRRVQRRARRQGRSRCAPESSGRQSDFVRRLDADRKIYLRNGGAKTANACRRSAAQRITQWYCPMPISNSRPMR